MKGEVRAGYPSGIWRARYSYRQTIWVLKGIFRIFSHTRTAALVEQAGRRHRAHSYHQASACRTTQPADLPAMICNHEVASSIPCWVLSPASAPGEAGGRSPGASNTLRATMASRHRPSGVVPCASASFRRSSKRPRSSFSRMHCFRRCRMSGCCAARLRDTTTPTARAGTDPEHSAPTRGVPDLPDIWVWATSKSHTSLGAPGATSAALPAHPSTAGWDYLVSRMGRSRTPSEMTSQ